MEVEAAFERLAGYRGVQGCVVLDAQGMAAKTSMDVRCTWLVVHAPLHLQPGLHVRRTGATLQENLTKAHATIMPQLAQLAKNMLRELDPNDELTHLRVRSAKREVMVAARAYRVYGRRPEDLTDRNLMQHTRSACAAWPCVVS